MPSPAPPDRAPGTPPDPADPAALLAEHGRWLRTVVWARLQDAEGVEEVLAEVALAVTRQRSELRTVRRAAPWLYRIAVRQALLYRRRLGRRRGLERRVAAQEAESRIEDRSVDPLGWLLAEERRAMVRKALAQLPRRDAEILLLKYTEHWSYRQLGQHLDLSPSAVQARLHRARAKLRRALAALDVQPVGHP